MFKHLDQFDRPVLIVETGCVRKEGNWEGDGQSTVLFDKYVTMRQHGGTVTSIDIDHAATNVCRGLVSNAVHVISGDSVTWLKQIARNMRPVDLLYLDSFDLDTSESLTCEVHHVNELIAALPMVRPHTLVVVDDSPIKMNDWGMISVTGKGALVARHAVENGAELQFAKYQVGWTGMDAKEMPLQEMRTDDDLRKVVERAWAYLEKKNSFDAAVIYKLVLDLTSEPKTPTQNIARGEACMFFGRAAMSDNRPGLAMDWYRKAIAANPHAWGDRLEYATRVLRPQRLFGEGQREAQIATRTNPEVVDAWRILGGFEHDLGNMQAAKDAYAEAVRLAPDDPLVVFDLISILLDEPDYAEAGRLAGQMIGRGGEYHGLGYECLGFIAYRTGRHEESVGHYDRALALGVPQEATCHWNKSLALHALGRYREGWKEHEWRAGDRTQTALYMPMLRFSRPLWKGEPPPCSIHVHAEAGAGDNLCCARYLQMLTDRGHDVRFEAYADMVPLMQRSFPAVKVVPQALDYPGALGVADFDYHQPIGGLPHVLGTEVDTVPWFGPYLHADPDLVAKYREKLPLSERSRSVGLCWSSGIREGLWIAKYGQRKSMHFDDLRPILDVDGFDFISLQVGPERTQNRLAEDVLPEKPSWDDTAALVANLDLVITVDTAVAHLAGAMGKPVWLMNSAEPGSWHWMAERPGSPWNERSPWYPSVKIYRQRKVGEWGELVERIVRDLAAAR